jgi:hypothetical protein
MTNPRDPDTGLEELLRNALHGEAERVSPAGDGLARIQQRAGARRGRRMWLRPVAVVGGAAVAAVAGFTAYAVTSHPDQNDRLLSKQPLVTPTASVTPSVTPSKTVAPVGPVFPAAAFYPFTSAAAEQSWEAQKGPVSQAWITNAVSAAKSFVADYVLVDGVGTVMGKHVGIKTATVTLGRTISDASSKHPVKVTTVRLQRFGKAWLVVGADDPGAYLKVTSPSSGARVSSPLTVSGPAYGVEEAIHVDVRAIGAPLLTASRGQASFGNGSAPWTTTVAFAPPADPRGAVVVVEDSMADGGPARIVATGVTFDSEQTGYPAYFYGVKNSRITKFSARSGAAISYLTQLEPGGGPSDPQLLGDSVYYLSGSGTCANSLRSVGINGGASADVAQPAPGYVITGYAAKSANQSALFETACDSATTPQAKLVVNSPVSDTKTSSVTTDYPAVPPGIVGDPSWDLDSSHFDVVMRTGTRNALQRLDGSGGTRPSDAKTACAGYDLNSGEPQAVEIDANGYLWFAVRTGSSMQVVRCIGDTARAMFTVAGNRQPADVDVAGSGTAVLLTDTAGHVWRWSMGGGVVALTPSVAITQLTW